MAFYEWITKYYDPKTNRKNFHTGILDSIELMIQEGLIDKNTKGYDIPCDHLNTETYIGKKSRTKINYCFDCKTILKGVLSDKR